MEEGSEEKETGSRFYMLTEIDKEYEEYTRPDYDEEISLKELCEEFRNYSAGKLKLYYYRRINYKRRFACQSVPYFTHKFSKRKRRAYVVCNSHFYL